MKLRFGLLATLVSLPQHGEGRVQKGRLVVRNDRVGGLVRDSHALLLAGL
jgi:hypothetical protein